jgi:urea transport system permease protein
VQAALQAALAKVTSQLAWGERLGVVFTGISLGSILLLAALGLAITYGLMGVINMAHGELMMIGAYATYVVQNLFRAICPSCSTGTCWRPCRWPSWPRPGGAMLERSVIRFLYGRPLETLLATWGISLILMQAGAHDLRRAERAGGEPGLDVRRLAAAAQPDAALQPHRHHRVCRRRAGWRGG